MRILFEILIFNILTIFDLTILVIIYSSRFYFNIEANFFQSTFTD